MTELVECNTQLHKTLQGLWSDALTQHKLQQQSTYLVSCPQEPLESYRVSSTIVENNTKGDQAKNLSTNLVSGISGKSPLAC